MINNNKLICNRLICSRLVCNRLVCKRLIVLFSVLFICTLVVLNFYDLTSHIFQMFDDYIYSRETKRFLETGSYHWAGAKPGIILLASLFRLDSPQSIIYMFTVFGVLTGIVLFYIGMYLFQDISLSIIPVLLWFTSPIYLFYSRTHLLIYVAFYLLGTFLCFKYLEIDRRLFYLGWFLLGFSTLCYYAIIPYLVVFFIYFLILLRNRLMIFIKSVFMFLLPIVLVDGFAVLFYLLMGKKNLPFLYSVISQFMSLVSLKMSYPIFYYVRILLKLEPLTIFLVLFSLIVYIATLFRKFMFRYSYIYVLLLPSFILELRTYFGHYSGLRAYLAIIPVLYLLITFAIYKILNKKYYSLALMLVLIFSGTRTFLTNIEMTNGMKTYYYDIAKFLDSSCDTVVYSGQRCLFDDLLSDQSASDKSVSDQSVYNKRIIPLNIANDPLESLKKDEIRNEIFSNIEKDLNSKKLVFLVVANPILEDLQLTKYYFEKSFKLSYLREFSTPHRDSILWPANTDSYFFNDVKNRPIGSVFIFKLELLKFD